MSNPTFLAPDGVYREQYTFTTTMAERFFSGEMDPDTVDMQVSIRGAGFVSDPDLIVFEGNTFVIPNPAAYPNGLQLFASSNVIGVRSILTNGTTTATSTITATLSLDSDIGTSILPPTGVKIERFGGTVKVSLEGSGSALVTGYNFYASTSPGGGTQGYYRINIAPVTVGVDEEVVTPLATLSVDIPTATNLDSTPRSTPQYFILQGTQQNRTGTVYSTDFNESLVIPSTVDRFRSTTNVEQIRRRTIISFVHDRQASYNSTVNPAIPNSSFTAIATEDPLYYVASAIYLVGSAEIESEFSTEVSGQPLNVSPNVGSMPTVGRQQIVRELTLSIFRTQPQIAFTPGSTTRDLFIDPFATEAERIRFVLDFIHNAQSIPTLLRIDDPTLSGTSIPVAQSAYKLALKQAFFIRTVDETQALIDRAFEHRAANFGLVRAEGRRARGEATFYLSRKPTETISIPIGQAIRGGGVVFRTTSSAQITPDGSGAFFNPKTGRYSVTVYIQAEDPGIGGNLTRGQINTVVTGVTGLAVTNQNRTFGGTNQESNRDLANRTIRALSSVDSGRLQGYADTANKEAGVLQVNIVDAGHPLMLRDLDTATGVHRGGKVDVWVRGSSLAKIQDTFAFSFEIARDMQFVTIGDPRDLKLRAVDSRLSSANPIIEVLDYLSWGYGIRNATKGQDYDLTDVQILSYNTIQLSLDYNDPADITLTDVITGDYRYRTSNRYVFNRQPVISISSFTGDVTGVVSSASYALYHPSSPLGLGASSEAGDYLQVINDLAVTGDTIPSGTPIVVTGEAHVMADGLEYINFLGVNPLTITVLTPDRTTTFIGPYDPSILTGATPDYTIIEPPDTETPIAIVLTDGSTIAVGSSVIIDYSHDENFLVEYQVNALVGTVQDKIDTMRHITADVIVKDAIPVAVDVYGTVVLENKAVKSAVQAAIRTNLNNLFNRFVLGEPVRQSDVASVIDATEGVSYVVLPLAHMAVADGTQIAKEMLFSDQDADFFKVTGWSTANVSVWLMTNALKYATIDGGGTINDFRGVFRNDTALTLVNVPPNVNGVPLRNAPNQAFIAGNGGLSIPGYSDDVTLQAAAPFATQAQIDARRVEISANKVLISLTVGDSPVRDEFWASYVVTGDSGVKNIEPGPVSYLTLGAMDFTFDEDLDFQAQVTGRTR